MLLNMLSKPFWTTLKDSGENHLGRFLRDYKELPRPPEICCKRIIIEHNCMPKHPPSSIPKENEKWGKIQENHEGEIKIGPPGNRTRVAQTTGGHSTASLRRSWKVAVFSADITWLYAPKNVWFPCGTSFGTNASPCIMDIITHSRTFRQCRYTTFRCAKYVYFMI